MWDLISSTMKGRSVILTTHSMEECEALCSRIGIMVNGRLTCLGGAQHLKSRFGADYLVDVSVQDHADRQRMTEFILGTFPGSTVFESHGSSVKYKVLKQQPAGGVSASGAGAVAVASPVAPQVLTFAQIFRFVTQLYLLCFPFSL
jgi:ABC-type multidrug transport system ATPase subunit